MTHHSCVQTHSLPLHQGQAKRWSPYSNLEVESEEQYIVMVKEKGSIAVRFVPKDRCPGLELLYFRLMMSYSLLSLAQVLEFFAIEHRLVYILCRAKAAVCGYPLVKVNPLFFEGLLRVL